MPQEKNCWFPVPIFPQKSEADLEGVFSAEFRGNWENHPEWHTPVLRGYDPPDTNRPRNVKHTDHLATTQPMVAVRRRVGGVL